jgi:hypothetical protein
MTLEELKAFDPTADKKFLDWILLINKSNPIKEGDKFEFQNLLEKYNKVKHKLNVEYRNIYNIKSINHLYEVVKPFIDYKSRKETKSNIDKIYEDENYLLLIPLTKEAANYYGKNTKWCTASNNNDDSMFEFYNKQGPLYIFIDKINNEKYQFHFESNSFFNELDKPIKSELLLNKFPQEIINYFHKNKKLIYFKYETVTKYPNNLFKVTNNKRKTLIVDEDGNKITDEYLHIYIHDYYTSTYIEKYDNTIPNDDIIITVEIEHRKHSFITLNNKKITNNTFESTSCFFQDYGVVFINNKPKYINKQGIIKHDTIDCLEIIRAEFCNNKNQYFDLYVLNYNLNQYREEGCNEKKNILRLSSDNYCTIRNIALSDNINQLLLPNIHARIDINKNCTYIMAREIFNHEEKSFNNNIILYDFNFNPINQFKHFNGLNNFVYVKTLNNYYNIIDENGNFLLPLNKYIDIYNAGEEFTILKLESNKFHIINNEGEFISNYDIDKILLPINTQYNIGLIQLNNNIHIIDVDGNISNPIILNKKTMEKIQNSDGLDFSSFFNHCWI